MEQDHQPVEHEPIANHSLKKPKSKLVKRLWFRILIGLVVAGLVGFGVYALFGSDEPETIDQPESTSSVPSTVQKTDDSKHPDQLIYAYWEDDEVIVRSLNWNNGKKTDIFDFTTASPNQGEPDASVTAYDPNSRIFAFIDDEGLKLHDINTKETTLISEPTSKAISDEGPPKGDEWTLGFESFGISSPIFSRNGKYLSFTAGHYEGSSRLVVHLVGPALASTGDTFRYVDDKLSETITATPIEGNEVFKSMGILPDYYYSIEGASKHAEGGFNSDSSLAVLALQPAIGDSKSDGWLAVVGQDDSVQVLAEGNYQQAVFSKSGDSVFAVRQRGANKFDIEQWSVASGELVSRLDVNTSFVIGGAVQRVDLHSGDVIYASIKSRQSGDYKQFVVDVAKQDQLAEFLVDDESSFSILYAKQ